LPADATDRRSPTREVRPATTGASAGGRTSRWVSLSEASRLLGIAPGTLRRWADDGSIPVFTTPGGHRRFSRSAIAALLPTERRKRPPLERLGASAARITRAYRSDKSGRGAWAWADGLSDADRAVFRERGRVLVARLLEHLDAPDGRSAGARLTAAKRVAAEYGRETAERGCSLSDAVQGFLRFRAPFTDELAALARRRGLDTREATELLADAEAAMDELLIAMMTGHTLEAGPRRRSVRRTRTVDEVAGSPTDDRPVTDR
jgi:excisionase family DNA binding protein